MDEEQFQAITYKLVFFFSMGTFLTEFLQAFFTGFNYFFYETVIKLNPLFVSIGFAIFSVSKAVSDPFLGYFLDRPQKFWKRWGRRFPWIIGSFIPLIGMVILFFSVPEWDVETQAGWIFCWLLLTTILYGLFFSLLSMSYYGIIPEKFQSHRDRQRIQGVSGILSFLGMLLGALLPAFFIDYDVRESFSRTAIICGLLAFIPFLLLIPGIKENVQFSSNFYDQVKTKIRPPFFNMVKFALKQRNFRVLLFISFCVQVIMSCVGTSVHYLVKFIFHTTSDMAPILYLGYFGGAFIGTAFWTKISNQLKNTKKSFLLASLFMAIFQIPGFFLRSFSIWVASLVIFPYAFCFAGYWALLRVPITSDVINELNVKYGARQETTFMGIRSIMFQLGFVFQSLWFGFIHNITGFDETLNIQSSQAEMGIVLAFALIPLILNLICISLVWIRYTLTPNNVQNIQEQMSVLGS